MANREKGEVDLVIAGETYRLCLDTNAMAHVENLFSTPEKDVSFFQVFSKLGTGSIRHMRGILWGALQKHHPNLSVNDVGDLIQKAGGFSKFGDEFTRAMEDAGMSTIADKADLEELGVNANGQNPPVAQSRGRGGRSSATRVQ